MAKKDYNSIEALDSICIFYLRHSWFKNNYRKYRVPLNFEIPCEGLIYFIAAKKRNLDDTFK